MSVKDTFIMKCWFCHSEMKWVGDFDFKDYELDGDGTITILSCNECESFAEFWTKPNDNQKINKNKVTI